MTSKTKKKETYYIRRARSYTNQTRSVLHIPLEETLKDFLIIPIRYRKKIDEMINNEIQRK